ncbi:MAG TPA: dihydrofolate reductase [Candidatus Limnocylindria bacterium]|jgi:dihydrofolate reductase|nr:dihydrofolate reductase [Candidatus Limnocylindria bacterium]
MATISFVVAYDRKRTIGKDNKIPWRLPDDMRRVRQLTVGKPLIMGRRTWESIGRPLPERTSIVLTRDRAFQCDGCLIARTPDEALKLAGAAPEIIVFGGAGVFEDFLPRADRIYLTEVDADVGGDTFFPPLDPGEWEVVEAVEHPADERHAYDFSFLTLDRKRR